MRRTWDRLGGQLGILYCLAGFLLVFLGWNGAASYDETPAQVPYLISGGLAGLALVVLGSALLVVHRTRGDQAALRQAIDELRAAVQAGSLGGASSASAASASASSGVAAAATAPDGGGGGDPMVVAGPTSYHRPTCRLVEGQVDAVRLPLSEAAAGGRTPCRVCSPGGAPVRAAEAS